MSSLTLHAGRAFLVAAVVLLWPAVAAAQLRAAVSDPAGHPLGEATVELWSPTRALVNRPTGPDGTVRFSAAEADSAAGAWVRRIGYRPARVQLAARGDSLHVVLEPKSLPLPELTVAAVKRACPNREQPAARELWERMRRRYVDGAPGRRAGEGSVWSGLVAAEEVGAVPAGEPRAANMESTAFGRDYYRDITARYGYALRIRQLGADHRFFAWEYVPLWSGLSDHFAEPLFGERHQLAIGTATDHETVLTFCPRSDEQPALEGTITIAADGSLLQATWRYRTPKPDERAGGETVYAPIDGSVARAHLLPIRSIFWRKSNEQYFQEAWIYSEWRLDQQRVTRPPDRSPPAE